MRRPVFLLLLILLQITLPVKLSGQKPDYRLFDNISLGTEASVINCFLQDTQGLIWIGSNKGLLPPRRRGLARSPGPPPPP